MEAVAVVSKGTLEIVKRDNSCKSTKKTMETSFREEVARIMREGGASEAFINRELTDSAVRGALKNNFSAESLAWALLQ